jgi:hypothetical protein
MFSAKTGNPPRRTPKWLLIAAGGVCALSVLLLMAMVIGQGTGYRRDRLTTFVVIPLLWTTGAMSLLGIAGAFVTGRLRWLWLILAAGVIVFLMLGAAVSKFNYGM